MQIPTYNTFMAADDRNREIWYKSFVDMANLLPQTGTQPPENYVPANQSCLYVQTALGVTTLWVNQVGNGSKTGWVAK